jgi:hypothetical protein
MERIAPYSDAPTLDIGFVGASLCGAMLSLALGFKRI